MNIKKIIILLVYFVYFLVPINNVFAACKINGGTFAMSKESCAAENGIWVEDSTSGSGGSVSLTNPLGTVTEPQVVIGKVINALLGIVGSIALVMFIYGGFTWMFAGGNSTASEKGRSILIWATVGLFVIFSSYAMIKFVFKVLGQEV